MVSTSNLNIKALKSRYSQGQFTPETFFAPVSGSCQQASAYDDISAFLAMPPYPLSPRVFPMYLSASLIRTHDNS